MSTIVVKGRPIDRAMVKMLYRCEVCLSPLEEWGAGVRCTANHEHRGYIHRKEAEAIRQQQAANVEQLSEFYTIENGKVVIKCQS